MRRRPFEAVSAVNTVPKVHASQTSSWWQIRSTFRRGILASPTSFPSSCPCRVPSTICILIEGFYASFSTHRRASPRLAGEGRGTRIGRSPKGSCLIAKKSSVARLKSESPNCKFSIQLRDSFRPLSLAWPFSQVHFPPFDSGVCGPDGPQSCPVRFGNCHGFRWDFERSRYSLGRADSFTGITKWFLDDVLQNNVVKWMRL